MQPHDKYKSNAFNLASQEQKIIIIFDGITKLLNNAVKCVETNNFEGKNTNLQAVIEALYSLRDGIDHENGGQLAKHFDGFLYSSCRTIQSANMKLDAIDDIQEIIAAISEAKDLFKINEE